MRGSSDIDLIIVVFEIVVNVCSVWCGVVCGVVWCVVHVCSCPCHHLLSVITFSMVYLPVTVNLDIINPLHKSPLQIHSAISHDINFQVQQLMDVVSNESIHESCTQYCMWWDDRNELEGGD